MSDAFCRTCGEAVGRTDIFCGKCGRRISSAEFKQAGTDAAPVKSDPKNLPQAHNNQPSTAQGVHGWLKFFCICLCMRAGYVYRLWQGNEVNKSVYAAYPSLEMAHLFDAFISSAIVLYGGCVGLQILFTKKNGKRLAMTYLWFDLAAALVIGVFSKLALGEVPEPFSKDAHTMINFVFILNASFAGAWLLYFKNSKRVRETYGEH